MVGQVSDQAQRTQWALDLFREFIRNWAPMAMQSILTDDRDGSDNPGQKVRRAIRNIAPQADDTRRVGWAVFKREHDREYSRERPSGWVHTMVSAVFEEPAQATNALAFLKSKSTDHFVICEIQEIP